ncbi:hypothetical protein ACLOJK_009192 [Asimina triloba]
MKGKTLQQPIMEDAEEEALFTYMKDEGSDVGRMGSVLSVSVFQGMLLRSSCGLCNMYRTTGLFVQELLPVQDSKAPDIL